MKNYSFFNSVFTMNSDRSKTWFKHNTYGQSDVWNKLKSDKNKMTFIMW